MMESNKRFGIIIVIVTVSTLVTILTPVESKGAARSLLTVSPPSNPPSESESPSPSPAPGPEATTPSTSPSSEIDIDSPAASPNPPTSSISLPPSEIDMDSPSPSPESDSASPANSPSEVDTDSPAPSPEAPADSVSPTSEESPDASSGKTLMSSPKNLLKQSLLSPEFITICGKTDYPPLCESSVSSLLTADVKPDVSSVLVLAIQAAINATKAAMPAVDKVAAADCQELYDDAVTNLEDAINAVKSGDNPTVNTNLSAAMTDYGTCNDGFEESGEPNPLADVGDKLTKMVSNCLAISTLIK